MEQAFDQLHSRIFYFWFNTHCGVDTIYSKQYKKVYVRLCKETNYKNDGEDKQSKNFVLYTVNAAEELVMILGDVVNFAKKNKKVCD